MECIHGREKRNCAICSATAIYAAYRRKALDRGLFFALSQDEFDALVQRACVFCGELPGLGIDRKDNRVGYILVNCQPCCWLCNRMKRELTPKQYLDQARRVTRYNLNPEAVRCLDSFNMGPKQVPGECESSGSQWDPSWREYGKENY